jgi:hypothetical protein
LSKKGVAPFVTYKRVAPCPDKLLSLSDIADKEKDMFDSFSQEQVKIAGTTMDLYKLNLDRSKRDPLYDEPIERVYDGPYRMKCVMDYPASIPSTGEEGFRIEWPASVWIPRKELEDADAPTPFEGDVIRVWDTPFYRSFKVPASGFYFDVINVDTDGHLHDTPTFVGFRVTLKRRTEMAPERKIFSP